MAGQAGGRSGRLETRFPDGKQADPKDPSTFGGGSKGPTPPKK